MQELMYWDISASLEKAADNEEMPDEFFIRDSRLGEDAIVTCGNPYRVMDKNLIFLEGTYMNFDEENGLYEPDFSLTLIYKNVPDDRFEPRNYLYFEQDGPELAIYNFLRIAGIQDKMEEDDEKEIIELISTRAYAMCG